MVIKTIDKFKSKRIIFQLRDEKSTIRSSSIVPTLKKIVSKIDEGFKGITVIRYLQTPFVSTSILDEAISSLIINNSDTACGVELIDEIVYKRSQFGLELISSQYDAVRSDFDNLYKDSQTFLALRNSNLKKGSLKGPSMSCFEVSKEESFFIKSKRDLEVANILLKNAKII